jgi:hypothetical protein
LTDLRHVSSFIASLGTWVTICEGYVIELQEGARVFLKAGHVLDCVGFDKLLNLEATSVPHLRYNLVGEHRELRERYRNKNKGKGKLTEDTSSSDEGGKYKKAPLQRQFRKQTLPSLFLPTASPASTNNGISSHLPEHCSPRGRGNLPIMLPLHPNVTVPFPVMQTTALLLLLSYLTLTTQICPLTH